MNNSNKQQTVTAFYLLGSIMRHLDYTSARLRRAVKVSFNFIYLTDLFDPQFITRKNA